MNTNRRIVVGVDGSPAGERALRWAVRQAAATGAAVRAVTAFTFDGIDGSSIRYRREQRERAEQMLSGQVAAALNDNPRVSVTTSVLFGAAADILADAAEGADLLVLGSHGHGRLFHAVLGSVAEACVRAATCPVVVIPAERPAEDAVAAQPAETGLPAGIL